MAGPSRRAVAMAMAMCMAILLASSASAYQQTLASFAKQHPDLGTFASLLTACPSLANARGAAWTVFAPSDQAFNALLASLQLSPKEAMGSPAVICSTLQNHVLPHPLLSSAISKDPLSVDTLLPGSQVTLQRRSGGLFVNAACIVTPDLHSGQSVVHIVDRVLLPPAMEGLAAALPTLKDSPTFAKLWSALTQQQLRMQQQQQANSVEQLLRGAAGNHPAQAAGNGNSHNSVQQHQQHQQQPGSGLVSRGPESKRRRLHDHIGLDDLPELSTLIALALSGLQTPVVASLLSSSATLFVPTNAAIAGAIASLVESSPDLLTRPEQLGQTLARVLMYHAATGVRDVTDATSPVRVRTLEGSNSTLTSVNGTKRVNGYRIVRTYLVRRWLVHAVDRLLIPPSVSLPVPQPPPQILHDIANGLPEVSDIIESVLGSDTALEAARSLVQTPLTVFFPSNQAVLGTVIRMGLNAVELLLHPEQLLRLLSYHFVPQLLPSFAAPSVPTNVRTLEGSSLFLERTSSGEVRVNGVRVIRPDIRGGLSYVHTIERFLVPTRFFIDIPGPSAGISLSLGGLLAALPEIGVLAAGALNLPFIGAVARAIDPSRHMTVMVPRNTALAAGWIAIIDQAPQVLTQPALLQRFLAYHISGTQINPWAWPVGTVRSATTLANYNVTINVTSASAYVNNVRLLAPNSRFGPNFSVLVLNRILSPPGFPRVNPVSVDLVNDLVNGLPEASDLVAEALASRQIRQVLSHADDQFTFFAPSNQAIRNLLDILSSLGVEINLEQVLGAGIGVAGNVDRLGEVVDNPIVGLVLQILSYHVVPSRVIRASSITSRTTFPTLLQTNNLVLERRSGVLTVNGNVRVVRSDLRAGNAIIHIVDSLLLPPPLNLLLANPSLLATLSGGLGGSGGLSGLLGTLSSVFGGRR